MNNHEPVYIRHLSYCNTGPIASLEIEAPFDAQGNPKPIVLVGENGAGKSTVLSNITDSFLEIGGLAFDNVLQQSGLGHQYYKSISSQQIKIGTQYQVARIEYTNNKSYIFKAGNLSYEQYKELSNVISSELDWEDDPNFKKCSFSKKEVEDIFGSQVICSFLSNRYEKPSWMGDLYHLGSNRIGPTVSEKWSGKIRNNILVEECKDDTLSWLMDVIVDSRTDIKNSDGKLEIAHNPSIDNTLLFGQARLNIEKILSAIVGRPVYFDIAYRNAGASRFRIKEEGTDADVCLSFDSLSTGQIVLFELFATIIRYADNNDINSSLNLDRIKGIVAIDEIDLHLHAKLQRDVLPRLIKMFPGVQFIFSTHSPLLLLGLERELGADGYLLIELPTGNAISPEGFKEFELAYDTYISTNRYIQSVREHLESEHSIPLVITEGTTDWRILEKVQSEIQKSRPELFRHNFKYLKHSAKCESDEEFEMEMGDSALVNICKTLSSFPLDRHGIIIAIFDRDNSNALRFTSSESFCSHGNGVYSFALPVPSHRESNPDISIEQLLEDSTMLQFVECEDGISRRLHTSNEFDSFGRCTADSGSCLFAKGNVVSKDHTKVIDGGNIKLVSSDTTSKTNYALSKIAFAKAVVSGDIPLTQNDIDSFIPIFQTIQSILKDALSESGACD